MIRQDDKRFKNKWIKEEGCVTLSVFYIVNKLTNYEFSIKEIEKLVKKFIQQGVYTKDMLLYWQKAFEYFGIKVKYHKELPTYVLKKNEYEITAYYNPRTKFTHFVVTHGDVVIYDPLGLSVTVREGYQKSKRVFEIL